MPPAII
jgi:putative transposase